MAFALISNVSAASSAGNTITSSAIDTTGANLLVLVTGNYQGTTISDSKSNTWTALTTQTSNAGNVQVTIYYAKNPTVGTGHTFTATATANYPSFTAAAFSGADTASPFDVQNGTSNIGTGTTLQSGSITPSANNYLVIAGIEDEGVSATATIDGGFTIAGQSPWTAGQNIGSGLAYLIQTTAAAANPTWTMNVSISDGAAVIASFKGSSGVSSTASVYYLRA